MSTDEPPHELEALRTQVASLLRTEAHLYRTRAALDRQLAIYERLHELGIQLLRASSIAALGELVTEFATHHLRYDAALVLYATDERFFTTAGSDGFAAPEIAMLRALELPRDNPFMGHIIDRGSLDGAGTLSLGGALGLDSFSAHALAGASGVVLAGRRTPAEDDEISRRGLANLSTLAAAMFDAVTSRVAMARERARLAQRVDDRTRDLTRALDEVTRLSRTDPLTGLINRRAFMEYSEHAIALARRHGRSMAVIAIDVDHFKNINDTFGHKTGDDALVEVARALVASVRDCDHVGRLGGEEFMILLAETTPAAVAEVGARCRQALHGIAWPTIEPGLSAITASFGIAIYPDHAADLDALLRRADDALYRAKRKGRNTIVTFRVSDEA